MKTGFENLRVYQLAEEIADITWDIVSAWDYFAKDTLGKQFVRAVDSIGESCRQHRCQHRRGLWARQRFR